jgi:hypothetical protein
MYFLAKKRLLVSESYFTIAVVKNYFCNGGIAGADPGFQVRGGGALKKLRRAEGGAKFVGVFRVKNHDFMHIYFCDICMYFLAKKRLLVSESYFTIAVVIFIYMSVISITNMFNLRWT